MAAIVKTAVSTRLLTTCATSLQKSTTVSRGTEFEQRSQRILQNHLSMALRRVGGKSDGGVDLLGWWWLPALDAPNIDAPRRRLRVIAQCKAEKKKVGPKYVREMEGVMQRYIFTSSSLRDGRAYPGSDQTSYQSTQFPLVALLVSESPYTVSTLLRAQSSPVPFYLLHIPPMQSSSEPFGPHGENDKWTGTAVWNPALAGARGLLGGEMETRWERLHANVGRPSLWWRDQRLKSWTPDIGSMEMENLDLTHEDLLLEKLLQGTG